MNQSHVSNVDSTIEDFGAQWNRYTDNSGYYGSTQLLKDIISPLLLIDDLKGLKIVEIGSGTGRIVGMLIDAGAGSIVAVEPSSAFSVLCKNTELHKSKITYLNLRGDELPSNIQADLVVSIGVLHHIPTPDPTVRAAYAALKPGGKMFIWLYGNEGNELYIFAAGIMRSFTTVMPDWILSGLCWVLDSILELYCKLCRFVPLPMRDYFRYHYGKLPRSKRRLTIFDQLNPGYAKYYFEDEARSLLERAGFTNVTTFHRHGYSWSVIGEKPKS